MSHEAPDQLMRRKEAAEYLTSRGHKVAAGTLAKYAINGTGPEFVMIGRFPYYTPRGCDAWLERSKSPAVRSRSELPPELWSKRARAKSQILQNDTDAAA